MVLRRKEGRKVFSRGPCFELYEEEEKGFLENLVLNGMKKEGRFPRGPYSFEYELVLNIGYEEGDLQGFLLARCTSCFDLNEESGGFQE